MHSAIIKIGERYDDLIIKAALVDQSSARVPNDLSTHLQKSIHLETSSPCLFIFLASSFSLAMGIEAHSSDMSLENKGAHSTMDDIRASRLVAPGSITGVPKIFR